jgi:hypothetical protein
MNSGRVCVGAHDLDDDFRSLRLLTKSGMNLSETAKVAIGDVLDLDYVDHEDPDPPHIEDVLVQGGKHHDHLESDDLRAEILEHIAPWEGSPETIFDGRVAGTHSGRVYVPDDGPLPSHSTGYWIPDADLVQHEAFGKVKFLYTGSSSIDELTWAGVEAPPDEIAAGTLVRVSLARWFNPSTAPSGYYAQISGVY